MDTDERGNESEPTDMRAQLLNLPTLLRFGAFILLVVGFIGILETDAEPLAADSVYSLVFMLGIVCAIASIYLAIYRHGDD